jgi:hypothetical protein
MAIRYRALLIGNSTYLADEHNLQTLKGPVKDIAVLNRALVDPAVGLFDDADVTLLPEATSSRAIRALGRFFGAAARDDVLLVYFSGHGKLDQSGRLHLCMQDTESTDLLSTAVSSTRINEFADASHARNVIIVLDCCHAGAFRGGELGDAVAGPGRYVMTSCRGTQLANDATVDNGTSYFTQHLVDGLLGAAGDQNQDGYVSFSDLYAYVDRRLREVGKQIPQQRVSGDGDVPLARRSQRAPADFVDPVASVPHGPGLPSAATSGGKGAAPPGGAPAPAAARGAGRRRGVLLAAAAAAVVVAGGVTAALVLDGGSGATPGSTGGANTYTASGPWRLMVQDSSQGGDPGCSVALTDAQSGQTFKSVQGVYGTHTYQIHQAGSFQWQVNDPRCLVTTSAGPGNATLPLSWLGAGDTDAFVAPAKVAVHVDDYAGSPDCTITLSDPASGQLVDSKTATSGQGNDTVTLDPGGIKTVYLSDLDCKIRVTAVS